MAVSSYLKPCGILMVTQSKALPISIIGVTPHWFFIWGPLHIVFQEFDMKGCEKLFEILK